MPVRHSLDLRCPLGSNHFLQCTWHHASERKIVAQHRCVDAVGDCEEMKKWGRKFEGWKKSLWAQPGLLADCMALVLGRAAGGQRTAAATNLRPLARIRVASVITAPVRLLPWRCGCPQFRVRVWAGHRCHVVQESMGLLRSCVSARRNVDSTMTQACTTCGRREVAAYSLTQVSDSH